MMQNGEVNVKNSEATLQEIKYIPTDVSEIQKFKPEILIKSDTIFLYFTVYTALLPFVVGGSQIVWLSSAYPSIISNNSDVNPLERPATTTDISMIGGMPSLIALLGPLLLTKLSNKIGRKLFLQINAYGLFLCNIAEAMSTQALHIIISRSCLFTFFGVYAVILQVYISEICEDHNRAKYLCIMALCIPLGNIYSFLFGPIFNYKTYTLLLGIPMLPFLVLFFFVPESPIYLLSKGRKLECKASLKKLRSNKNFKELDIDFNKIIESKYTKSTNDKSILYLFKTKETRLATLFALLLGNAPHLCGISTVMSYLGPLLLAAGTNISENIMTVTVASLQVIGVLCTSFVIGRINRRTLLLWSCVGCGVPFCSWGVFYYLQNIKSSMVLYLQWLPLFSVIISTIMFCVGIGPVTTALISELFPSDFISSAVSLVISVSGITVFIIISAYPFIVKAVGVHWCLWVFGFDFFVVGYVIYLFLPETKGKSIVEVQEILKKY